MDDFTAEIIAAGQDRSPQGSSDCQPEPPKTTPTSSPSQKKGLRGGLAAIREKAGIQDRLVERHASPPRAVPSFD